MRRADFIRAGPVDPSTSARRILSLAEVNKFVMQKSAGEGVAELAATDVPLLSNLVWEFGFALYDAQRPQGELREIILSIQDRCGYEKPALVASWRS